MRSQLPFYPFQRPSVLPEVSEGLDQLPEGRGEGGSAGEADPGLSELRRDNVTAAIAYGLVVSDLAIRDVLSGGRLGILGRREHKR